MGRVKGLAAVVALTVLPGILAAPRDPEDIVVGQRLQIESKILGETRTIEVHLPDDYLETGQAYPVLVVLDGGAVFRYCVSLLDMLAPHFFPEMIVVGLPNTDRNRDLYPPDKEHAAEEGGSLRFLSFLEQELIPRIETQYRALPYRVLAGHSLAGLFTVYALIERPALFDGYIATSPSLRAPGRMELMLERLGRAPDGLLSGRYLYFSAGGEEPEVLQAAIRQLDGALAARQGKGFEHHYDIFSGEGHVPVKGFYQGLRGLFPTWMPSLDFFFNGTLEDIEQHYSRLSARYGFPVVAPPLIIRSVGDRFVEEEKWPEAVEVYRYYVSTYPRSAVGWVLLAEACTKAGDKSAATDAVKKALEIEPDNERARSMLKELDARPEP